MARLSALVSSLPKFGHAGAFIASTRAWNPTLFAAASPRPIQVPPSQQQGASETVHVPADQAQDKAFSTAQQVSDKTKDAAAQVSATAQNISEKARQTMQEAWASTKNTAQRAADTVLGNAHSAKNAVQEDADSVVGKAQESADYVRDRAESVKRSMNTKNKN